MREELCSTYSWVAIDSTAIIQLGDPNRARGHILTKVRGVGGDGLDIAGA
ncbi:MAG: hypothetical protein AAGH78_18775 [Cyanobacteria bacterium P01_H01_bin.58]